MGSVATTGKPPTMGSPTLTLLLPRAENPLEDPGCHWLASARRTFVAAERILIVDDEASIRYVLTTLIRGMGLEPCAAGSAPEALPLLEGPPFAAALLDIVLPGMNGLELLGRLKQKSPDTEVLIMTSHASVETAIEAIRKGAYDYFHKPFELDDVSAKVQRAIEKRELVLRNRELMTELEAHNRELRAAVQRLASLNAAGQAMGGIHTLSGLLDLFLELVVRELDVERASLMLVDDAGELRIAAARGLPADVARDVRMKIGEGVAGKVAASGRPLLVDDADSYPELPSHVNLPGSFMSVPVELSVPIKAMNRVLGVINVTQRRSGTAFGPDDVSYLAGLAGQAAVAIDRARHLERLQDAVENLAITQQQLLVTTRLKALGELAAGVAHDFNNTLSGILGSSELLLAELDRGHLDEPRLQATLQTITQLALQAAACVRRLQDAAGVRRDRPEEEADLNQAVRLALDLTQPKWQVESELMGRPVRVALDLGEIPVVRGDPQEIAQAISNLVFNAVEAMPNGGHINLRTSVVENTVQLEVADDGAGMSPEVCGRIFDPFFTTKNTGHGLGLSVVQGIIKRMGGSIAVRSTEGAGTTFTVTMPVAERRPEATPAQEPPLAPSAAARLLVIDDDPVNLEVCAEVLKQGGHEVVMAPSGEEGLAQFQAGRIDLVITDLCMPGLSGWQVVREIKKQDATVPVIVLSGWGVQLDESSLREAGVDLALTKPVPLRVLLRSVNSVLAARRTGDTGSELDATGTD